MDDGTCRIKGCEKPLKARWMCSMHYEQYRIGREGRKASRRTLRQRFLDCCVPTGDPDGCWVWQGARISSGYGAMPNDDGTRVVAHRIAYELFVGPVPDGLVLDHLCHNRDKACPGGKTCPHRLCVNPAHLEAVTHAVNIRRGRAAAFQLSKTHCPHGHEYSVENTRVYRGRRFCIACKRAETKRRRKLSQR